MSPPQHPIWTFIMKIILLIMKCMTYWPAGFAAGKKKGSLFLVDLIWPLINYMNYVSKVGFGASPICNFYQGSWFNLGLALVSNCWAAHSTDLCFNILFFQGAVKNCWSVTRRIWPMLFKPNLQFFNSARLKTLS